MTKEELKLTSKEALKRLEMVLNWSGDIDIDKDLYDLWVNLVCRTIEKDLDRLEEYRKIEKELGIDLKVYHKLMSMLYCGEPNILYVKDKDTIVQVSILELDYCKKKIIFYKDKSYNEDYVYAFIQYGKTFALTREELKEEI